MFREGLMPYWWMLYRQSKVLRQRTDIFRNVEDAFALKHGDLYLKPEHVHLDIGSGLSMVPGLLYQRRHARTYATELDPVYLDWQQSYMDTLGFEDTDIFFVQREDATQLTFADCSVNFITAISIIEHIPGDGDSRSMAEFARVLPSGGRVVVTVPTDLTYLENSTTAYYKGFERRYDPAALRSRLYHPDLALVEQLYMVSPPPEFTRQFDRDFEETFRGKNGITTWYENGWHDEYPDVSILLTLGFVRLSTDPANSFGACLAFERK